MFGLTEDAMSRILNQKISSHPQTEINIDFIANYLIPNIVDLMKIHNGVILSYMEKEILKEKSNK